jgi:hypothetical protein
MQEPEPMTKTIKASEARQQGPAGADDGKLPPVFEDRSLASGLPE